MRAALLAAVLALAVVAVTASAASVTPAGAQELRNLIVYANTTYNISAVDDRIVVQNTDANHTLLLVFNPVLGVTLFNVSGAHAVLVNVSDYSIVEHILGNATSYDIVGYGGEARGLALGLVIPRNSSASIGWVYYEARSRDQVMLSAVMPPEGFKVVGDRYGTSDDTFTYLVDGKAVVWVAFHQGVSSTRNPSDLIVSVYEDTPKQPMKSLSIGGERRYIIYGRPGGYETKTFTVENSALIVFNVKTYTSNWKTAWRVIYAVKSLEDPKQPDTEPTQPPSQTTQTPAASLPSGHGQLLYAAAGAGAMLLLLVLASVLGGRRR